MTSNNNSAAKSPVVEDSLPNAWLSLLAGPSSATEVKVADTNRPGLGTGYPALSTSCYANTTFGVLHRALQAAATCNPGPNLDRLAGELQRLFRQFNDHAVYLENVEIESGGDPFTALLLEVETQQARTIAETVNAVSTFVRGRALGEFEEETLDDSWLRILRLASTPQQKPTEI